MELAQLRYLTALDDERNFTRAAERCHVTQQSLSAAVSRLERTLGVQLVARTTRTVTLTPAGEAFAARARRALAEADAAAADARAVAAGHAGRPVLGFHGPGANLAAPWLDAIATRRPGLHLDLRRADFTDPTAGVLTGDSDLGLVAAPLRHPRLRHTTLTTEDMVVVLSEDHPLAARRALTAADLAAHPVAEMPNPRRDPVLDQWNAFWTLRELPTPPPTVPVRFAGVEEWLASHRHAPWFSTGPASAARLYPADGITWRACPDLPSCTWRLYTRTDDVRPAVRHVLTAARGRFSAVAS